jgi:hypothetical protein
VKLTCKQKEIKTDRQRKMERRREQGKGQRKGEENTAWKKQYGVYKKKKVQQNSNWTDFNSASAISEMF